VGRRERTESEREEGRNRRKEGIEVTNGNKEGMKA
jgi:hypothetical protein